MQALRDRLPRRIPPARWQPEELEPYRGKVVALRGGKVVMSAATIEGLAELISADTKPVEHVFRVPVHPFPA